MCAARRLHLTPLFLVFLAQLTLLLIGLNSSPVQPITMTGFSAPLVKGPASASAVGRNMEQKRTCWHNMAPRKVMNTRVMDFTVISRILTRNLHLSIQEVYFQSHFPCLDHRRPL